MIDACNRLVLSFKEIKKIDNTIKWVIIEGIRPIIEVKTILFFWSLKVLNDIMKGKNVPKSIYDCLRSLILDFEPLELYCKG